MLGANFVNARNSEVDRQRKLRSENLQAYNAFVETQKASGARVNAADFEKFRNNLATNPYMNAFLPSETAVQSQARQINVEVARREAAAANAARAASLARAEAEFKGYTGLVTTLANAGVDLTSEAGQTQLSQMALRQFGIKDTSAFSPLLPGMINANTNTSATSFVTTMAGNGITTLQAAQPFIANLPPAQRTAVTNLFTARDNQKNTDDSQAAAAILTQNFNAYSTAGGGDTVAALAAYNAAAAVSDLGKDPAVAAATKAAFEAFMKGNTTVAERQAIALFNGETLISNQAALELSRDPTALRDTVRAQLVASGIPMPTDEQVDLAANAVSARASRQANAVSATTVGNIKTSVATILQGPDSDQYAALRAITTPAQAEDFIAQFGQNTSRVTDAELADLVSYIQTAAGQARTNRDTSRAEEYQAAALVARNDVNTKIGEIISNNSAANVRLQNVQTTDEAAAFVATLGVDISTMSPAETASLYSSVLGMASVSRNDEVDRDAAQWTALVLGHDLNGNSAEGVQAFKNDMVRALANGEAEVLGVMNSHRESLGMDPYSSTADPEFKADLARADNMMRGAAKAETVRVTAAVAAAANAAVSANTANQSRGLAQVLIGQDTKSAVYRLVGGGIDTNYYLGTMQAGAVVNAAYNYLETHPDIRDAIEKGDVNAQSVAAEQLAAALGLPSKANALAYETINQASLVGGEEWAAVTYGTSAINFVDGQVGDINGGIEQAIAAIELLPTDADPTEIAAIRDDILAAAPAMLAAVEQNVREGGYRYVLDYAQTNPAALNSMFTNAAANVQAAIDRLNAATPKAVSRGVKDNGDGTVTLAPGNAQGAAPGTYKFQTSPGGLPQADLNSPIALAPASVAPASVGLAVDPLGPAYPEDPNNSGFTNDINAMLGVTKLSAAKTELLQLNSRISTGYTDLPSGSPLARAWGYFTGTEEERLQRAEVNELRYFMQTREAAEFLATYPGTRDLLYRDPLAWQRLAKTGRAAPPRVAANVSPQ